MSTWDMFQRMLKTPHEDLHKIRKAIENKYSGVKEPGDMYSVLDTWEREESYWLTERDLVPDEEAKEALIEAGML